ncbi:hypothetical protein ABZY36_31260 [Streptomyces sp. NPDC006627]|uniref:hypothetical protein n=1 Tax=Streptomyces sp. NPDC006627 TaxID=3154679 RepID=UPI0033A19874
MRRLVQGLTVAGAATATALFAAGPAAAAPIWQSFTTNANWVACSTTVNHRVSANIAIQTCLVRTPDRTKQQAVLVLANRGTKGANVTRNNIVTSFGGNASCNDTRLDPGEQIGCFGPTVSTKCDNANSADAYVTINGLEDRTNSASAYVRCG